MFRFYADEFVNFGICMGIACKIQSVKQQLFSLMRYHEVSTTIKLHCFTRLRERVREERLNLKHLKIDKTVDRKNIFSRARERKNMRVNR